MHISKIYISLMGFYKQYFAELSPGVQKQFVTVQSDRHYIKKG